MDSIFVYPGGKASIRNFIWDNAPAHSCWVDLCGGGASITVHKPESDVEVYNDIGFVSLFMAVLRSDELGGKLRSKLELTLMDEMEFQRCHEKWMWETDLVEQCRMFYVQLLQCFTHEYDGTGWIGVGKKMSQAKSFKNHVDSIPLFVERFRQIQIMNRKAYELIPIFDDTETLFYFDPPYMNEQGKNTVVGYLDLMTPEEHRKTLQMLLDSKSQFMVSGYMNPLYESMLGSLEHQKLTRKGMIKNNAQDAMGIIKERTEHLWIRRNTTTKAAIRYEQIESLWS